MDEYNKNSFSPNTNGKVGSANEQKPNGNFQSGYQPMNNKTEQPFSAYKPQNQAFQQNVQPATNVASNNYANNGVNRAGQSGFGQRIPQSPTQNQVKAKVKFMPTNLPPASANTTSGPLNQEEIEYLGKISDQNYFIKKRLKKSKGKPFNEPRALSRIRRLLPLNFARRYYGFPPKEVKKLRDRMGDDKSKVFGAAARRAKNLILSMVLIVALIATMGTGAIVAILAVNNGNNIQVNKDGLVIVNADEITPINGYSLGMWQDGNFYIKTQNKTGTDIKELVFYITLTPTKDSTNKNSEAFSTALANGTINPAELIFSYKLEEVKGAVLWAPYLEGSASSTEQTIEGTSTYDSKTKTITGSAVYDSVTKTIKGPAIKYVGGDNGVVKSSSNQEDIITVISNFSIDIKSPTESNKWAGLSMTISFVVEADPVDSSVIKE